MIQIKPVLPMLALLSVVHDGAAYAHEQVIVFLFMRIEWIVSLDLYPRVDGITRYEF